MPQHMMVAAFVDLRDWFAGQAMAGMFTAGRGIGGHLDPTVWDGFARDAYAVADAMLEARAKGQALYTTHEFAAEARKGESESR